MSATVDERVVQMKFDNKDFEQNVQESLSTLDKLKNALKFTDSAKNFDEIGKAARGIDLSGMVNAIDNVQNKFSLLEVAGITAIAKITSKAMDMGTALVKSLSVDQISSGFNKYAQVTSSIQTILAATREQGENIQTVTAQVDKLLWFTDETSYSLVDMTNNISKFTSNGIKLADATRQMQGVATAAALAGANSQDASHAMEGFAKAMGQQFMSRQNWSWIRTAHMDTVQFKQSLIDAAVELGTLKKAGDNTYITLKKNKVSVNDFETAMKDAWISAGVMEKALATYGSFSEELYKGVETTGLTASELLDALEDYKAGTLDVKKYTDGTLEAAEELESVLSTLSDSSLDLSERSFRAAQEAKTFGEAIDSVKDAVSSGWMKTFDIVFGNYEEAKKLWTGVANAMYDVFAESGNTRNEILAQWKDLGGRNSLIAGFVETANAIAKPIEAAKKGFKSILPDAESFSKILFDLTEKFKDFMSRMQPSEEILQTIYIVFKALAITLKTVVTIIGSVFKALFPLLKPVGTLLNFALKIIQYISAIIIVFDKWLQQHQKLGVAILAGVVIFLKWQTVIGGVYKALVLLRTGAIVGLIAALLTLAGVAIYEVITNFDKLKSVVSDAVSVIGDKFKTLGDKFKELIDISSFKGVGKNVTEAFSGLVDKILNGVNKLKTSFSTHGILGTIKELSSTMGGKLTLGVSTLILKFGVLGRIVPLKFKLIGAAITTILPKFIDFSKVPSILTSVFGKLGPILDGVKAKFTEFLKSTDKVGYIFNLLKTAVTKVASMFKSLGSAIGGVAVTFGSKAYGAISKVINAFKDAIGTVGLLRKGVSAHELETASGVEELNNNLDEAGEKTEKTTGIIGKIKEIFENLPEPIKNAGSAIADFFKNLDPGQLIAIAFTITMLALVSALGKFIKATTSLATAVQDNIVSKVGGLIGSLTGVVNDFRNLPIFKGVKQTKQTFKDFAEGLALIGVVIGALAFVPQDDLKSTVKYVGMLMVVFAGLYAAILVLNSVLGKGGLNPATAIQSVATMFGMVASIAALAGILLLLKDYPIDESIIAKLLLIGSIGMTMVALMALMSRIPDPKGSFLKQSIGMVLFAVSIGKVVKAFKDLVDIGIDQVTDGILPLLGLVAAVSILSLTAGRVKLSSVLGFYLLIKVFASIFPEVRTLAEEMASTFKRKVDFDKLLNMTDEQFEKFIGIAVLLGSVGAILAVMFYQIANAFGNVAKGIISLAVAIAIITRVADSWKTLDGEGLKQVMLLIGEVMLGFAAILGAASLLKVDKKTQKLAMNIGLTALALTVSFAFLVGLTEIIGLMPEKNFAQAEAMITSVMALFAAIVGLTKLSEKANPKVIQSIAVSIIALMGTLIILSIIKPERLISPTIAMVSVMAAFGQVLKEVGKMQPNPNAFKALIAVVASLAVIGATLYFVSQNCDWKNIAATGAAMTGAFIGLSLVMKQVAQMKPNKESFKALLAVVGMLAVVGATLGIVAYTCDWQEIVATGGAMTASFIGLSFVIKQVGSMKSNINSWKALLAVAVIMAALGTSLYLVSRNNWDSILAAGGSMTASILAFALLLKVISSSSGLGNDSTYKKKILMLVVAAGIVVALGAAMSLLAKYSWDSIAVSMLAISGSVLMLIASLYLISKTNFDLKSLAKFAAGVAVELGALYLIAKMIPQLSTALSSMESVNWDSIGKSAVAMLATIGILTGLGVILGKTGGKSMIGMGVEMAALVALSYFLPILGESLSELNNTPWEAIGKAAVAMLATIGILTGLGVVIGLIGGTGIIGMAAELAALVALSYFLPILGESLSELNNTPWEAVGKAAVAMLATIGILTGLSILASFSFVGMLVELAALVSMALFLPMLGEALTQMAAVPWDGIGKAAVALLATIGILTGLGILATFDFIGIAVSVAALALMIPILLGLAAALNTFSAVPWDGIGKAAVAILGLGAALTVLGLIAPEIIIGSVALIAMSAAMAVVGGAFQAFATAISTAAIKIAQAVLMIKAAFSKSADFGVAGMVQGFQRSAPTVAKTGAGIGTTFLKGFYASVGQASPWASMTEAMGYMGQGIVDGVGSVSAKVNGAGQQAGATFISGLWDKVKGGLSKIGSLIKDAFGGLSIDTSAFGAVGEEIASTVSNLKDEFTGLGENLFNVEDFMSELGIEEIDLSSITEGLTDGMGDLTDSVGGAGKAASKAKDEFKEFKESLNSTLESKTGGMNFFNKLELKTETTAASILENMRSNINGVASWTARLAQVAERGLDQGLIKVLAQAGLDSYDQVSAFLQMSDEQIAEANQLFALQAEGRAYAVNTIGDSYLAAGQNIAAGLANGVREGQTEAVTAIAETDTAMQEQQMNDWDMHSPSGVTRGYGQNMDLGLMTGISGYASKITSVVAALCRQIKWYFDTGLQKDYFIKLGNRVGDGLKEGIKNSGDAAIAQAESVARRVGEIMANALKVESPSRVTMWIGKMVDLGLAKGMSDNSKSVEDSSKDLAKTAMNPLKEAMSKASDYIADNIDVNPTITPMLDLTNLMNQADSISGLFTDRSVRLSAEADRTNRALSAFEEANGNGRGSTYNFTQNNYSPKALSRVDIYRNTNNQFSALKAVTEGA